MFEKSQRDRLLGRYRFLFRVMVVVAAISVVAVVSGVYAALFASTVDLLSWGVVLFSLSALSLYKYALSTMKLMESDPASFNAWR
jgi:hypothetical protein